jgi:TatD DNase family protein
MPPAALIHWYDGDDRVLNGFIDRGCFFSISPAVICEERQREICLKIPRDRLLAETDNPSTWPWLFGTPAEGGQIRKVYTALAGILKTSEEELVFRFRENARAFLMP